MKDVATRWMYSRVRSFAHQDTSGGSVDFKWPRIINFGRRELAVGKSPRLIHASLHGAVLLVHPILSCACLPLFTTAIVHGWFSKQRYQE